MSYQVLARKWRPKNFADVVGQAHILTALSNGLKENRLHHAYLFSGTRGVGKTSIARLFAKGLNCVNGVSAEPCGVCEHCKAIEEGRFIDLIEIDAASRTKVEDTRELLDNVQYKPVQGRYKVYLIDEVHMLSRHSFNALLKTLEEPPEYVKFLLATTDPQKLPVTILSRCIQFHLKALEREQIAHHLARILHAENIPFEALALDKLAKAAQGSIRDSLSLTDQAIAMSNGNITLEIVNTMLGLLSDDQPIEILYALQQGNAEALMKGIQSVADKGGDWDELLSAVAEMLHHIAMQQLLPQGQIRDESPLGFLAKHIAPEDVQFFYQIIVSGRKELPFAPNRRAGAEMILMRALAFHPKLLNETPSADTTTPAPAADAPKMQQLLDVPVLSQNIKAKYQPQTAARRTTQVFSSATSDALEALEQLSKPATSAPDSVSEKKNRNVASELPPAQSMVLPVVEPTGRKAPPTTSQRENADSASDSSLSPTPQAQSAVENTVENEVENDSEITHLAENYRWEWINPEMAKEQQSVRLSEIKRAMLQHSTPELQNRIVTAARKQDSWTDTVENIAVSGLVKEMAMHCFLVQQSDRQIKLGLSSAHFHLNKDKTRQMLGKALSEFYGAEIDLTIEENNDSTKLTPQDYRNRVYHEFSEQAKQDLQADAKLGLLQQEFDAQLDLGSIRPV
ncbi:DNA polymerase III subunit gamma/tau [Necropsobacter massiliensis]|uniref:DNA polymerase III subunit gamma/tau n=1 Tax=Necropsobacter massiliensis TaxID=1400001 RepID=UPI0005961197|nr:DNA polymerase III subunit gamma/tau [Necropsobacter massiliensis]